MLFVPDAALRARLLNLRLRLLELRFPFLDRLPHTRVIELHDDVVDVDGGAARNQVDDLELSRPHRRVHDE